MSASGSVRGKACRGNLNSSKGEEESAEADGDPANADGVQVLLWVVIHAGKVGCSLLRLYFELFSIFTMEASRECLCCWL